MKKTTFNLFFAPKDSCCNVFEVAFELPNSVNPADFLSQVFPDYYVDVIDYSTKNINLCLRDGVENVG